MNFGERQAGLLIQKLLQATLELILVNQQGIALTKEYKERWLEKLGRYNKKRVADIGDSLYSFSSLNPFRKSIRFVS